MDNIIVIFTCVRCGAGFFERRNLRMTTTTNANIFYWVNRENLYNIYTENHSIFCAGCNVLLGGYNFSTFQHWVGQIRLVVPRSFIVSIVLNYVIFTLHYIILHYITSFSSVYIECSDFLFFHASKLILLNNFTFAEQI